MLNCPPLDQGKGGIPNQADRVAFVACVFEALGPAYVMTDFAEDDLTPKFDYYADDNEDDFEGTHDEILSPTPEMDDNYADTRVQLPREMTCPKVE